MGFLPTASEAGDSEAEVLGTSTVPHSHWLPPSPRLGKGSVVLWLLPGRRFVTRWPLRTQAPRRSASRQQPSPTTSLSGNPDSHQTSICFLRWWVISLAVVSVETESSLQFRVFVGFQVKAVPTLPSPFSRKVDPTSLAGQGQGAGDSFARWTLALRGQLGRCASEQRIRWAPSTWPSAPSGAWPSGKGVERLASQT